MKSSQSNQSGATRQSLRISSVDPPGWSPSKGRVPAVGQFVYCLGGPAKVVKVLGRTGDGSRLLELKCEELRQAFFASSGNVLFQTETEDLDSREDGVET